MIRIDLQAAGIRSRVPCSASSLSQVQECRFKEGEQKSTTLEKIDSKISKIPNVGVLLLL
jgi:hypothetical protein